MKTAGNNANGRNRGVRRLWLRAWGAAAAVAAFGCLYFFVRQYFKDGIWLFDLALVNKSLGTASLFLLTLSMFLTGVAYFSNRGARPLAFRKHYGLVGFWVGIAHAAVSHLLLPLWDLHPERKTNAWLSDGPGVAALVLFAMMAAASNPSPKERLGGAAWRRLLRYAGYAGLVLSLGHTVALKASSWTNYFRTFGSVIPSLSLPVALFAAAAVLLRLAVWVSQLRNRT